jgi:hypothetical protein
VPPLLAPASGGVRGDGRPGVGLQRRVLGLRICSWVCAV